MDEQGTVRDARRAQEKSPRQGQGARDVAGRRLRAQVQTRLRDRGGLSRQEAPRRADPGAVDARGRHQVQLLQLGQPPVPEGGPRRRWASDGLLQRSAFTSFFATLFPPPAPSGRSGESSRKRAPGFTTAANTPTAPASSGRRVSRTCRTTSTNLRIENCPAPNHIRCGWMRSVANIYHAFGHLLLRRRAGDRRRTRSQGLPARADRRRGASSRSRGRGSARCFDNNGFPRPIDDAGGEDSHAR